mgnify:CR=1 FL=1
MNKLSPPFYFQETWSFSELTDFPPKCAVSVSLLLCFATLIILMCLCCGFNFCRVPTLAGMGPPSRFLVCMFKKYLLCWACWQHGSEFVKKIHNVYVVVPGLCSKLILLMFGGVCLICWIFCDPFEQSLDTPFEVNWCKIFSLLALIYSTKNSHIANHFIIDPFAKKLQNYGNIYSWPEVKATLDPSWNYIWIKIGLAYHMLTIQYT